MRARGDAGRGCKAPERSDGGARAKACGERSGARPIREPPPSRGRPAAGGGGGGAGPGGGAGSRLRGEAKGGRGRGHLIRATGKEKQLQPSYSSSRGRCSQLGSGRGRRGCGAAWASSPRKCDSLHPSVMTVQERERGFLPFHRLCCWFGPEKGKRKRIRGGSTSVPEDNLETCLLTAGRPG